MMRDFGALHILQSSLQDDIIPYPVYILELLVGESDGYRSIGITGCACTAEKFQKSGQAVLCHHLDAGTAGNGDGSRAGISHLHTFHPRDRPHGTG